MGEFTTLMARDGHEFNAWLPAPKGAARGAIVIAQEIFGVNHHIRACRGRIRRRRATSPSRPVCTTASAAASNSATREQEVQEGRGYRLQIPKEKTLLDLTASLNVVKHAGRVAVVGYCWGGTLAYLAACEMPIACAVSYYGGQIKDHLDKSPRRPVLYHFGEKDPHIPAADIEKIRAADPTGDIPPLSGGPRFQLRGARQLTTPPAPRSRSSARWTFLVRADGAQMIKLKDPLAVERTRPHRRPWVRADSGLTTEIRNPANGERARHRARHGRGRDAPRHRGRARGAARLVEEDRRRTREHHAQMVRSHDREPDDLAVIMTAEQGKPLAESRARSPTRPRSSSGSPKKASASTATSSPGTRPTSASWCCASPSAWSPPSRRGISRPR